MLRSRRVWSIGSCFIKNLVDRNCALLAADGLVSRDLSRQLITAALCARPLDFDNANNLLIPQEFSQIHRPSGGYADRREAHSRKCGKRVKKEETEREIILNQHRKLATLLYVKERPFDDSHYLTPVDNVCFFRKFPMNAASKGSAEQNPDKPTLEQLQIVYNKLQKALEQTFTHPMDYSMYHKDVVFIDNIRNIRTEGLPKYIQQVAFIKIVGHVKFAYVRFEILNMSMNHQEGRVTVRWRIKGLSGLRVMLKFWKYKLWKWQEIMKNQETWHDGISYFDVGGDGKVFQHIADKVMEDKQREVEEVKSGRSIPLAAKLGALATIFPTPSLSCENTLHSSTFSGIPTT